MCTQAEDLIAGTGLLLDKRATGDPDANAFMNNVLAKGGCEGWVQCELAGIFCLPSDAIWVKREVAIYNNTDEQVDFVIKCRNGPSACVELKVESLYQSSDDGRSTMDHSGYKKVLADVQKLQTKRSPLYANEPAFVVAMVWSEELTGAMFNWLETSILEHRCEPFHLEHCSEEYNVTVFVITVA